MRGQRQAQYTSEYRVMTNDGVTMYNLNLTKAGLAENNRIGDDAHGISCHIKLHWHLNGSPTDSTWFRRCKVLILRRKAMPLGDAGGVTWDQIIDKKRITSALTDTDWSSSSADLCSGYIKDHPNYEVIKDMNLHIDQNNLFQMKSFGFKFDYPVKYQSSLISLNDDYIFTNQLLLMMIPLNPTITSAEQGQAVLQYGCKYEFYE